LKLSKNQNVNFENYKQLIISFLFLKNQEQIFKPEKLNISQSFIKNRVNKVNSHFFLRYNYLSLTVSATRFLKSSKDSGKK